RGWNERRRTGRYHPPRGRFPPWRPCAPGSPSPSRRTVRERSGRAGPCRRTCATGPWGTDRCGRLLPHVARSPWRRSRRPNHAACRFPHRGRSSGRASCSWFQSPVVIIDVGGVIPGRHECVSAVLFGLVQFSQHLLDVEQLPLELLAASGDLLLEVAQLPVVASGGGVHIDQFLALGQ